MTARLMTTNAPSADARTRVLPSLDLISVPPFVDGAEGFEVLDRYRGLFDNARKLKTAAEVAEANVNASANADAEAEAEAIIAGEPAPKPTAVKAAADADAAFRKAHPAILAANKMRVEVLRALQSDAATALDADFALRSKATSRAILNRLEQVASDLQELAAYEAGRQWIAEVQDRKPLDHALRSLPSVRQDIALTSITGVDPLRLLSQVGAIVEPLGRDEEQEAA
ncbi:MAG: hypothetical protein HY827_10285 [Actinobacteria bacterium]|nr:hypothetical protein [Actinomycetota bacterium]